MLEMAALLLIGTLVAVSVMVGVMKLDTYLWQRKRIHELDAQHESFMKQRSLDQRHMDLMMRTGMNPVFAHAALCSPSRQVETQMLRSELGLTPLPPPAVVTPEEAMAEGIPGWDGTFIHFDDPLPAPALFMQETVEKLKEITNDRTDET